MPVEVASAEAWMEPVEHAVHVPAVVVEPPTVARKKFSLQDKQPDSTVPVEVLSVPTGFVVPVAHAVHVPAVFASDPLPAT